MVGIKWKRVTGRNAAVDYADAAGRFYIERIYVASNRNGHYRQEWRLLDGKTAVEDGDKIGLLKECAHQILNNL